MVKTTLAALAEEELVGLRHPRGSLTPSSECCPQFQPAAKYTQLLQGPLEGARARYEPPAPLTQRDGEVLARKPAKELLHSATEERPILEPGGRGSLLQIERFTMCPLSLLPYGIVVRVAGLQ